MAEQTLQTEQYKELPIWQQAYTVGRSVNNLTKDFPQYNVYVHILREKTAALPVSIALASMAASPVESVEAHRSAYELAHDAEYVLLFCLIFRYLPLADIAVLRERLTDVKKLILDATAEAAAR